MKTGSGQTLREREAELEEIATAAAAAQGGGAQLLVVEGPAGIGKSTLLQVARREARSLGMRCLAARGSELESRFPFGMVHQLFDPVVLPTSGAAREALFRGPADLARPLFEERVESDADRSDSSDALYRRLDGLYWLVANVASKGPLAIVFDDAHWADEASLEFAAFLARRLEELPLLLVVGTRPVSEQGRPLLTGLVTEPAADVIRPSPLTRASVDAWVRAVVSADADPAFVEACHASTSGIPFLVHELLQEVASERLEPTAAEAHRVGALTPGGVSAVVGLRMAHLPPGAVDLARAVAVLGDGTGVGTAAALIGLDETKTGDAARALVRAGIVEARDGLSFTHPVVRATVYEAMDPAQRSAAHAQAASLLRSRLSTPDQIATHLLLTEPAGDETVVETLHAAARRAASIGALDTARAYLERALAEPPPDDYCSSVLTDLGTAEGRLGMASAVQRLEQAMEITEDFGHRAEAALQLARVLKMGGEAVRAIDLLEPFEARADELEPRLGELVRLEFLSSGWLSGGARLRLGKRITDVADPGEPKTVLEAFHLAALAFNSASFGINADDAARYGARAAASDLLPTDPANGGYGSLMVGVSLAWSDHYDESEAVIERMIRDARRTGSRPGYAAACSMGGLMNMRRGALLDAERDAIASVELGRDIGGTDTFLNAGLATYGDIACDRGLPEEQLRERLHEIESYELDVDALPYGLALHAKGRLEVALGNYDEGIKDILAAGRREVGWGAKCPAVCSWRTSAVLAYRDAGDRAAAQEIAEEDVRLARAFGAARPLGMALRAHALVGPPDEKLDGLREAVAVLERSQARLELARALVDVGQELRRTGEPEIAADALRRGQDIAARCGARGVAQVAHDELLAAGASPVPLVVTSAELLRPEERRVAELAVRGNDERAIAQELLLHEAAVAERLRSACERLGVVDVPGLAEALSESRPAPAQGPVPSDLTPVDFPTAVRDALRDFNLAHRLATNPLVRAEGSIDERAESVRSMLRVAADGAFGPGPADQLMRSILLRGYMEPAASHEEAADELHVSRSTYFRRLREATDRLTEYVTVGNAGKAAAGQ